MEKQSKILKFDFSQTDIARLNELLDIAIPIVEHIYKIFINLWNDIDGDVLVYYRKIQKNVQWKYVKKGKKYVKIRRNNDKNICRSISKKLKNYKKKV